jgi:hypothetical protein
MQAGNPMISGAAGAIDAAEIQRRLQASAGDPQRMAAELRQMFPGASISVGDSMVQGMFDPQLATMMGIGTPQPQAQPAPVQADPVAQLERLASLRDSGAITDDEFAAAKARLLGS